MSARKSRKGSPIPKKSAPKSRNDSASGRNKRGRPAKNKTGFMKYFFILTDFQNEIAHLFLGDGLYTKQGEDNGR